MNYSHNKKQILNVVKTTFAKLKAPSIFIEGRRNRARMKTTYLLLNSRDELLRIDTNKIVYLEADGNYTNIYTVNRLKGVVSINLSHMQQTLSETLKRQASVFVRIGKKHIINHTYIYSINVLKQKLTLSDGEKFTFTLDVSKEALKNLKNLYTSSLHNNIN